MAKQPVTYWKATDVRDIAEALIPDWHEHLAEVTIMYVFRSQATEKNGRVVLGSTRKVSGLNAYLAMREMLESEDLRNRLEPAFNGDPRPAAPPVPSFYVIEIAHDTWAKLDGPQRIALVDHELSHLGADGLVSHDVEEFRDVIARHGLWKPDLKDFASAMNQVPLFEAVDRIRPKAGSGIDSVTISTPNGDSVTLRPHDVH